MTQKRFLRKAPQLIAEDIKVNSISWSIGMSSAKEIDDINILRASLLAMRRAIDGLDVIPDLISVDGQFSPETDLKVRTIIKGDQSNENIMAASILAKVYRDNYMRELDNSFPEYGFKQHKGSPPYALRSIESH
jgi:Ribonuclease HII